MIRINRSMAGEAYELKKNSGHPKGTAELKVSLIVNYSGNRNSENERE